MLLSQPAGMASAFLVVLALCMIGITQFRSSVGLYGLQSILLGAMATWLGWMHNEHLLIFVGLAVISTKGIGVPIYLTYAARRIGCNRESGMPISQPAQLFIALACLCLLALANPFRDDLPSNALPAVGILLLGMQLMVTRRLAVSQILGFLVLENGIFLFTITQPHSMPILVEIGVLLDVLTGTMMAGLLAHKISKTFEHIDVTELKELRG